MITRFDHAVIGVRDLDRALSIWRDRLGFDANIGGRHTGRGTHNGIVRFGLDYIELISIYDREEVIASRSRNAQALVQLLDRAEGGAIGFMFATDDIEGEAERYERAGLDVIGPFRQERTRPDGRVLKWHLLLPNGESWGTPWPTLIQWDLPDSERLTWERPGQHANGASAIVAVAVCIHDLDAGVEFYQRQLGLPLVGRGEVPELGARSATMQIGWTRVDLLEPIAPGPIAEAIADGREHLWQVTVAVRDLDAARQFLDERGAAHGPAPGTPGGVLIEPEVALGARVVLVQQTT